MAIKTKAKAGALAVKPWCGVLYPTSSDSGSTGSSPTSPINPVGPIGPGGTD